MLATFSSIRSVKAWAAKDGDVVTCGDGLLSLEMAAEAGGVIGIDWGCWT